MSPPSIPQNIMSELLCLCTKESPFKCPSGKLYCQTNGIAMGSALGSLFANFYMCHIENSTLNDHAIKPLTYCRYVDDIYIVARDIEHIKQLQLRLQNNSVLSFTYEIGVGNKLPFLDVNVQVIDGKYHTSVYRKATNTGDCLNAISECPERYKISVIRTYIKRAYTHSTDWMSFDQEINRAKQILVNNGYSNKDVDREIEKFLNNRQDSANSQTIGKIHKVYYQNQMSNSYKTDERVIKDIIRRNVTCNTPTDKLALITYYKNEKLSRMIMNNNMSRDTDKMKQTNVIYSYTCNTEGCFPPSCKYIGMTVTTLSRRLTMHLQQSNLSAIVKHHKLSHNEELTRTMLNKNTCITRKCFDPDRLEITEAAYIKLERPSINTQCITSSRALKLFGSNLQTTRNETDINLICASMIPGT